MAHPCSFPGCPHAHQPFQTFDELLLHMMQSHAPPANVDPTTAPPTNRIAPSPTPEAMLNQAPPVDAPPPPIANPLPPPPPQQEPVDSMAVSLGSCGKDLACKFLMYDRENMDHSTLLKLMQSDDPKDIDSLNSLHAAVPQCLFFVKSKEGWDMLDVSLRATILPKDKASIGYHHARGVLLSYLGHLGATTEKINEFIQVIASMKKRLNKIVKKRLRGELVRELMIMFPAYHTQLFARGYDAAKRLAVVDSHLCLTVCNMFEYNQFYPVCSGIGPREKLAEELASLCHVRLCDQEQCFLLVNQKKDCFQKLVSHNVDAVKRRFRELLKTHRPDITSDDEDETPTPSPRDIPAVNAAEVPRIPAALVAAPSHCTLATPNTPSTVAGSFPPVVLPPVVATPTLPAPALNHIPSKTAPNILPTVPPDASPAMASTPSIVAASLPPDFHPTVAALHPKVSAPNGVVPPITGVDCWMAVDEDSSEEVPTAASPNQEQLQWLASVQRRVHEENQEKLDSHGGAKRKSVEAETGGIAMGPKDALGTEANKAKKKKKGRPKQTKTNTTKGKQSKTAQKTDKQQKQSKHHQNELTSTVEENAGIPNDHYDGCVEHQLRMIDLKSMEFQPAKAYLKEGTKLRLGILLQATGCKGCNENVNASHFPIHFCNDCQKDPDAEALSWLCSPCLTKKKKQNEGASEGGTRSNSGRVRTQSRKAANSDVY